MRNFLLKTTAAVISVVLLTVTAFADSSGFAIEKEFALGAVTPYDKGRVEIRWGTDEHETAGVPIAYGEFVLQPVRNMINKLAEKDGSIVGTAELADKVSENVSGAVLGGIFVQPAGTKLYSVDLETMTVLSSAQFGEIITNVAILDGLAYFGVNADGEFKFICADHKNNFELKWEFSSNTSPTSPALFNNYVIFGSGEDLIVHRHDSDEFKKNPITAEITNVFAGKYAVFMTASDGNLYKLRLNDDGTAEEDTLTSCKVGGILTAPAEYNNRVYVGSTEGFFVLDGLNMEVLKAFPELKNSSAPIITYGAGQRAYTVARNDQLNRDVLYSILDTDDKQTVSEIVKLIDYTNGKCAVARSGIMYFKTADGKLWALAVSRNNIFIMVLKVILTLAIIAMMIIIVFAWSKKRREKRPPQY